MTFTRGVFAFALAMLILGIVGSKYLVGYLFSDLGGPPLTRSVAASSTRSPVSLSAHEARPGASRRSAARSATGSARLTAALRPSPTVQPLAVRLSARATPGTTGRSALARWRATARRRHPHRAAAALPSPTPNSTTGSVSLARYWVGRQQIRRGNTIEVGYVINNPTGHLERVMLGASLKSSRALDWATSAVNDPYHDVVAIVPPGVSTHVRFFTLPPSLHPGQYDVAWGLRNTATGQREALVVAPEALRATR